MSTLKDSCLEQCSSWSGYHT